jgi:hypothetical protein
MYERIDKAMSIHTMVLDGTLGVLQPQEYRDDHRAKKSWIDIEEEFMTRTY